MQPSEFWKTTPGEYWAIAKCLNPELFEKALNTDNGKFFSDEEQEIINAMLAKAKERECLQT